jgi:hypothetical protein
VLSIHLWQLRTVVLLHWCLICSVLLFLSDQQSRPRCFGTHRITRTNLSKQDKTLAAFSTLVLGLKICSSISHPIKNSILPLLNLSDSPIEFYDYALCVISFSFNQTYSVVYKYLSLELNKSALNWTQVC